MDDNLLKLRRWASQGTLRQFYTEINARLADDKYEIELEGDVLTVYSVETQGGFLGIGGRKVREICLRVIANGEAVDIPEETADPEFVEMLAEKLRAH
jgi:hypothetical protein